MKIRGITSSLGSASAIGLALLLGAAGPAKAAIQSTPFMYCSSVSSSCDYYCMAVNTSNSPANVTVTLVDANGGGPIGGPSTCTGLPAGQTCSASLFGSFNQVYCSVKGPGTVRLDALILDDSTNALLMYLPAK